MSTEELLKKHQLRVTQCRIDTIKLFQKSKLALSTPEIETQLSNYDRVTLYRTLHSFTENGIIHIIPDDTGAARYGFCADTCGPDHHNHGHIHFKCLSCDSLSCLNDQPLPDIHVPGRVVKEINVILSGICENCSEK